MSLKSIVVILLTLAILLALLFKFLPDLTEWIVSKLSHSCYKKFWTTKSFLRRLSINEFVGLVVLCLIIIFSSVIPKIVTIEDYSMDYLMDFYSGVISSQQPSFVLLDIDNKTHKYWNESPYYTPRDRLRNLIDTAVQAKARLIIVDIDLSQSNITQTGAEELKKYLVEYGKSQICKENQSACPPIIFARLSSNFNKAIGTMPSITRVGFLEEIINNSTYMQWGSVEFSTDFGRRWRLWEPSCTNQQAETIPSIALLAFAEIRECVKEIPNALQALKPQNCKKGEEYVSINKPTINVCGLTISTDMNRVEQRIMYRIPWLVAEGDDKKPPELPFVQDYKGVSVLKIFSAQNFAESPHKVSSKELKELTNNIVVIGASYGYPNTTGDVHETPIGDMVGALQIINAIYTLLQDITIKPLSYVWWLVVTSIVIFIMTIFSYNSFEKRSSVINFVWKAFGRLVFIVIIGMLLYYTIILFENGTWFNIAIPVCIIQFYQWLSKKTWLRGILLND